MEQQMSTQQGSDVQAVDRLAQSYESLSREIGKVIIGQKDVVKAVIISLFSNGHSRKEQAGNYHPVPGETSNKGLVSK